MPIPFEDDRSEGVEGKFFVWTVDEIRDVLGEKADAFIEAYGVKQGGNWEGKNILELIGTLEQRAALAPARARLRGLCLPGRGPAGPLRGHVRPALVPGRPRGRRRGHRPLLGPQRAVAA